MSASIVKLLKALVDQGGSDLHLAAGSVPMMRLAGDLNKVEAPVMTTQDVEKVIAEITNQAQREDLKKHKSTDFAIKVSGLSIFRVNVFFQRQGLSAVFRALQEKPPTLEELGLPEVCRKACFYPQGLVLVTGPTGSGKSTTLAAMIDYINKNHQSHILTLEDPIEFQHQSQRCMVNQRQLGTHFTTFSSALTSALREDPDIILVGEMRDKATIELAITAAETGHLVFATLHTNSAPKTIDRIIDTFAADEQGQIRSMLSESLKAVLTQKLVPAIGGGRYLVQDILINNSAVSNLIREGKLHQIPSIMQTGKREGMRVMDQELLEAIRAQKITGHDAWEYANDKKLFLQWAPQDSIQTVVGGSKIGKAS
ncbi:type IV pilus twitching motility protein PilT [bacterium]|nr:type IV pilus twitching motility protein PilT [bacterium]